MISSLVKKLAPKSGAEILSIVARLTLLAQKMEPEARDFWNAFLAETYGELNGQRGLSKDRVYGAYQEKLDASVSMQDFLIGLQTTFVLICDLLIVKKKTENFENDLRKIRSEIQNERLEISEIGPFSLRKDGHFGSETHSFPYSWFRDKPEFRDIYSDLLDSISFELNSASFENEIVDYTEQLYTALFPKNLLHALGEFYTPLWLAKNLLREAGYSPGQSVVDPFSGSGVFGLAALSLSSDAGLSRAEVLDRILLLDINPIACRSSETNLILNTPSKDLANLWKLGTPVLCFDSIDGKYPDFLRSKEISALGARLRRWMKSDDPSHTFIKADLLATNPPWVGWEYIPETYRKKIQHHWLRYDLFKARGLESSFLKEDLSSLASIRAIDLYLKNDGKAAIVLKPTLMKSALSGRGIRRLSLRENDSPLGLMKVIDYSKIKIFSSAQTETCAWILTKGLRTRFPVHVSIAEKSDTKGELKYQSAELAPVNPNDSSDTWMISSKTGIRLSTTLAGKSSYQGRTGVFTGGANAVFYLEKLSDGSGRMSTYRNIVERAKRALPQVEIEIENDLVFPVVRGRDLSRWKFETGGSLLFPHSRQSGMTPLDESEMSDKYPKSYGYLKGNRQFLETRGGFAGWERKILEENFYSLQRIGPYTFSKYKVAWRYIATDFIVAVIEDRDDLKTVLPNDKVMFVGLNDRAEAHYLCGLLSSDPIRNAVVSSMTGTQISASAFSKFNIPKFDRENSSHLNISKLSEMGHRYLRGDRHIDIGSIHRSLNENAARIFGISEADMLSLKENLRMRFGKNYELIPLDRDEPAPPESSCNRQEVDPELRL